LHSIEKAHAHGDGPALKASDRSRLPLDDEPGERIELRRVDSTVAQRSAAVADEGAGAFRRARNAEHRGIGALVQIQITTRRLAQSIRRRGDVEYVVGNL